MHNCVCCDTHTQSYTATSTALHVSQYIHNQQIVALAFISHILMKYVYE